eukprot:Tbor_TRINITY_DN3159_c0_g1::TRINITY_DN3159_c0_g1_i1::g.14682::m.14682
MLRETGGNASSSFLQNSPWLSLSQVVSESISQHMIWRTGVEEIAILDNIRVDDTPNPSEVTRRQQQRQSRNRRIEHHQGDMYITKPHLFIHIFREKFLYYASQAAAGAVNNDHYSVSVRNSSHLHPLGNISAPFIFDSIPVTEVSSDITLNEALPVDHTKERTSFPLVQFDAHDASEDALLGEICALEKGGPTHKMYTDIDVQTVSESACIDVSSKRVGTIRAASLEVLFSKSNNRKDPSAKQLPCNFQQKQGFSHILRDIGRKCTRDVPYHEPCGDNDDEALECLCRLGPSLLTVFTLKDDVQEREKFIKSQAEYGGRPHMKGMHYITEGSEFVFGVALLKV